MSYLQLKNLTASYDKEIVLNNLSLDIKKGNCFPYWDPAVVEKQRHYGSFLAF